MIPTTAEALAAALDGKKSGNGWTAHCPAHNDTKTPNLSIDDGDNGKILVKCFAGCEQTAVIEALKSRDLWPKKGNGSTLSLRQTRNTSTGITLEEYATAKKLDVEFLKSCELSEVTYSDKTAIRMPYLDENGQTPAVRIRRELKKRDGADQRFVWRKGSKLCLYGLWRLNSDADFVFLVEGESDCHSLWHHNINALGLPGASSWKEDRDAPHLANYKRIYVVIEPDAGGEAVLKWIENSAIRDRVWLVEVPGGDVSQLHIDDPDNFKAQLRTALKSAQLWTKHNAQQQEQTRTAAWDTCSELAESKNILDSFDSDLSNLAVVGERRVAKILYLALCSRFLARPVSVIVKGPSSGGKSYLAEQVLKFFPDDAYHALTAMSGRSLAYGDEPLKHRFLVIFEAAGMAGDMTTYLIRSLLSEGCIRYETVEKTSDGLKPRLIHREGPTGLLATTTQIKLHPENETRLLSVTVTDSTIHTADILLELARDISETVNFDQWCALQRWLVSAEHQVAIPYAVKLAELIPPLAVRLRRDFTQILNLIKAHAILHQATRDKDDSGRIVATLDDYAVVRELVADLIAEGIEATVPDTMRETVAAVESIISDTVSTAQVARRLKLDRSAAGRRIRAAINRGYLTNLESKRGKPAKLAIDDPLPNEIEILPTADRLDRGGHVGSDTQGVDTPPPPATVPVQVGNDNKGDAPPPTEPKKAAKLEFFKCIRCSNWLNNRCSAGFNVSDPAADRHCGKYRGGSLSTPSDTRAQLPTPTVYKPGADL
ncbi:hypothetical protein N9H39_07090 [Gammaproteobacteria bacterium]|nr:hypothetical protein [Gammaproteobacteria bacterium]